MLNSLVSSLQSLVGKDFNIGLLLSIIKRSLIWITLLIVLAIVFVILYLRYTPPVYETSASFIKKTEKTSKIFGTDRLLSDDNDEANRQIQLIKSRLILERALVNLPLQVSYYKEGRTRFVSSELYTSSPFEVKVIDIKDPNIIYVPINLKIFNRNTFEIKFSVNDVEYKEIFRFGKAFETPFFTIQIELQKSTNPDQTYLAKNFFFVINNYNDILSAISVKLNVQTLNPRTQTVQISLQDKSPNKARDIVNAVTQEFLLYDVERKAEGASSILKFLTNQIDTFTKDIQQFQDSLMNFRVSNQYLDPSAETRNIFARLKDIEAQQMELRMQIKMLDWLEDYINSQRDLTALTEGLVDPGISTYMAFISQIKSLEDEKRNSLLKVTPNHSNIKIINDKLDVAKRDLFSNIENHRRRHQFKLDEVNATYIKNLSEVITIPEKEAEYSRLNRMYSLKEKFYLTLLDKQAEYSIAQAGIVSDYVILKAATVPTQSISPDKAFIWLVSIAFALVMGLVIIAIRYLLHNTIVSVDEIARLSDAAILGMIPSLSQNKIASSIVVNQNPKSIISEAFRSIRANLQFIANKSGPKTLAITSTISGEGKTFVSINLAAIISMLGKKVVILDLDMRRPRVNKTFNVENVRGVSTILIGKDEIEDCIYQTEIENFHFITSGPIPPNPSELILSSKFNDMVNILKSEYDYVIFDTPPIGLVTDALDIIKNVDYPIYVFRADYSNKSFIGNINRLIHENKISKLSVILNDIGRGVSGSYYGYQSGYGYGGYGYGYGYGFGYGYGYYAEDYEEKPSFLQKLFGKN